MRPLLVISKTGLTLLASGVLLYFSARAQGKVYTTSDGVKFRVETIVSKLEVPWSIAFDSSGDMYFTERVGRLSVLKKGEHQPSLIAQIDEAKPRGEGGLMGLTLHPGFSSKRLLYVTFTYSEGSAVHNKVVRFKLDAEKLTERKEIISSLPGSSVHNGCRIKFGPDGKLYVTAGDATKWEKAQDLTYLGGKILRMNDDGTRPADNPFPSSLVYVLGVRNPQGIDWNPTSGLLFETEHGPSGFEGKGGGGDEVNILDAGKNYGWPVIHHREKRQGMEPPLLEYSPAVAPASAAFYRGTVPAKFRNNLFFGCLRGERIERVIVSESDSRKVVKEEALLQDEFGRIREVAFGPDGFLYFSTSNRDGRGSPTDSDDRILRLVPVQ
ncbi:MAG: PQQ-dependent sugar dehydrogenase [Bacteroidota bacterium]